MFPLLLGFFRAQEARLSRGWLFCILPCLPGSVSFPFVIRACMDALTPCSFFSRLILPPPLLPLRRTRSVPLLFFRYRSNPFPPLPFPHSSGLSSSALCFGGLWSCPHSLVLCLILKAFPDSAASVFFSPLAAQLPLRE